MAVVLRRSNCVSGISIYKPPNTNPSDHGTHIFIAGAFIINSTNPPGCTDGEGIILDSLAAVPYYSQISIEQSLFVGNCSEAIEVFGTSPYGSASAGYPVPYVSGAPVWIKHITTWGNGLSCGGSGGARRDLVFPVREPFCQLLHHRG